MISRLTNCFVGNVTKKSPSEVPKRSPRLPHESPHRTRCGKLGKTHWGSQGNLDFVTWLQLPPPVSLDSKRRAWPILTKESWNSGRNYEKRSQKEIDSRFALELSADVHKVLLNLNWCVHPPNNPYCRGSNICHTYPAVTFRTFFHVWN